jgi:hypothetical protein
LLEKISTEQELTKVVEQLNHAGQKGSPSKAPAAAEGSQAATEPHVSCPDVDADASVDMDAARQLVSELPEELAIFDQLSKDMDKDARTLCARILALPVDQGDELVFEASLRHNLADSFAEGVEGRIKTAKYAPVVLERKVSYILKTCRNTIS